MHPIRRGPVVLVAAVVIALVAVAGGSPAKADASFVVDSNGDQGDGNPGDGICSVAADGSGPCTLRAAVEEANVLGGATAVSVPAMTIEVSAELFVARGVDVAITGAGPGMTVLDGPDDEDLFYPNGGSGLALSHLTVTGTTNNGPTIFGYGEILLETVEVIGNENTTGEGVLEVAAVNIAGTDYYGSLTIRNSTIADNRAAGDAGAIYIAYTDTALSIENSTLTGNHTDGDGGAIYAHGGHTTLRFVTIAGNTADGSGDQLWLEEPSTPLPEGLIDITGSVLQGGDEVCAVSGSPVINSGGGNVVGDDTCGLSGTNDLENTDAELGSLADNGGPTETMAILPASPAYDNALADTCPPTDQRGVERPYDSSCDSGAYEYSTEPPPPPTTPSTPTTSGGSAGTGQTATPRFTG